ncbi:MAG TPA: ABC transporter permease [Acidimicrobiales bacterium]|nr:ABC transporter permease [Acidimicrobiales bacterium]
MVLTATRPPSPRTPAAVSLPTRMRRAVGEVFAARELTANLVRRDLKVRHRGSLLGMLWSLTTPVLVVCLYYVVFRYILRVAPAADVARPDGNDVPFAIYFFAGLTLWNLFSNSLLTGAGSVTGAGYLLRKVYFPRAILPLSAVLAALVTFVFEFVVLLMVSLAIVGPPSPHLLWVPVIVVQVAVLAYGFTLLLSAVTVFLRDVAHFIGVFMQFWFWGTPVIYSLQWIGNDHPGVVRVLKLNPLTGPVVSFRNVVLLNHAPNFKLLAYSAVWAVVMAVVGGWIFHRWQRLFSEIV